MSFIVLGKGPDAVRLAFRENSVELRVGASVINGNDDMKRALQWVLDHRALDGEEIPELAATVNDICQLLTDLVPHGVPLCAWDSWWANRCDGRVEVGQ